MILRTDFLRTAKPEEPCFLRRGSPGPAVWLTPGLVRFGGRLRGVCFWLECWTTPTIPPGPQYREPMPEDLVSQRCAWPQACRAMATASIDSPTAWAAD